MSISLTVGDWISVAGAIASVTLLEGLLGVDNALILAMMVRHLPEVGRARALRYGILGAFGLRFIAVLLATRLLGFWPFEVGGGGYLLCLSTARLAGGLRGRGSVPQAESRVGCGLWGTVIRVEVADLAFSIDSILAAVGIADGLPPRLHASGLGGFTVVQWVVFVGGLLGIVAMRCVAGCLLGLLDRFRGLAASADFLVAWIGVKLVGGGLHHALGCGGGLLSGGWRDTIPACLGRNLEMPGWIFWAGMVLIVVICIVRSPRGRDRERIESGVENLPGGG